MDFSSQVEQSMNDHQDWVESQKAKSNDNSTATDAQNPTSTSGDAQSDEDVMTIDDATF